MRSFIICLGVSISSLVLLLVIGFYAARLYHKYSPVYKDIDIGSAQIGLGGVSIGTLSLVFHLDVNVMVTNPNLYSVKIETTRQGRALLAPELTNVGSISVIPGTLPAETRKEMPLKATINLEGFKAISLIRRFLAGPVDVYLEIWLEAVIEESLIFTSLEVRPVLDKKCGTRLDISAGTPGGLACGDSFDDLKFCETDDPSCDGVLCVGSSCMGVDEQTIKDATEKRDLYLGLTMALTFSLAFIVILCSGAIIAWQCKKYKSANDLERIHIIATTREIEMGS